MMLMIRLSRVRGRLASTVLRGESGRETADLPDWTSAAACA